MTNPQTTTDPQEIDQARHHEAQVRMRAESGNVTSPDPLVSFLYILMRDHLNPGKMESILLNGPHGGVESVYSNGWLANYCKYIAQRLRAEGAAPAASAPKPEPTPQFQIVFDAHIWDKEGQSYLTPKVQVLVDGQRIGSLERIAFEMSTKQAIPVIEIDQKDFPPDHQVFRVQELQKRFPWMKINVLPWDPPAPPPEAPPAPPPETPAAEATTPAPQEPEPAAAPSDPGSA